MSVPALLNKFFPSFGDWACGAWSGTQFFVLGNYGDVLVSPTAIEGTWTTYSPGASTIQMPLNGAAAYNDICVAISNGFDGVSLNTVDGGVNWTNGTIPLKSWSCIATNGAGGMWVALSEDATGNILITSINNGGTWTSRVGPGNSHVWEAVIWTGTKFIAGANDGYISTSVNGTSWTTPVQITASGGFGNFFYDTTHSRVYANVTAGAAEIWYSDDDGTSWTLVTPPFSSFDNAAGLYTGGIIVIRAAVPTTAYTDDPANAFDVGDNTLDFNPSTLLFGVAVGVSTAIGIGRFTNEYIYGTTFQAATATDDPFFHFTFQP